METIPQRTLRIKELTPEEEAILARKLLAFSSELERLIRNHGISLDLAMQALSMIYHREKEKS